MTATGPSTSTTVPGLIPVGYRWSYRPFPDGSVRIFTGGKHVLTVSSMRQASEFVQKELLRLFAGVYRVDPRLPHSRLPQPE